MKIKLSQIERARRDTSNRINIVKNGQDMDGIECSDILSKKIDLQSINKSEVRGRTNHYASVITLSLT